MASLIVQVEEVTIEEAVAKAIGFGVSNVPTVGPSPLYNICRTNSVEGEISGCSSKYNILSCELYLAVQHFLERASVRLSEVCEKYISLLSVGPHFPLTSISMGCYIQARDDAAGVKCPIFCQSAQTV